MFVLLKYAVFFAGRRSRQLNATRASLTFWRLKLKPGWKRCPMSSGWHTPSSAGQLQMGRLGSLSTEAGGRRDNLRLSVRSATGQFGVTLAVPALTRKKRAGLRKRVALKTWVEL